MTASKHLHRAGQLADGARTVALTPEAAGWAYSGLVVHDLAAGTPVSWGTGEDEQTLVPLTVERVDVEVTAADGSVTRHRLTGRPDVFAGPSDFVYAGRGSAVRIASSGAGELAVCTARCANVFPTRYVAAGDVQVEHRGAGSCAREVRNFAAADAFDCDRLIAVEVITPGGNWSSYPPHKHDEDVPGQESVLEEIYYMRIADGTGADGSAHPGMGYLQVYGTAERPIEVLAQVGTGDVVTIPHGWHGPAMATPGYDMYYLNVMAGPGDERAWLISDDPAHGWIRRVWEQEAGR